MTLQQASNRRLIILAAGVVVAALCTLVAWLAFGRKSGPPADNTPLDESTLDRIAGPTDPWKNENQSPAAKVEVRQVTLNVPVTVPLEKIPGQWAGPVFVAAFGPDWVTDTREFTLSGEAVFTVNSNRASHIVGVVAWGEGCFTEVQRLEITPQARTAGTIQAQEISVRRKCELFARAQRGTRSQAFDTEQPVGHSEGGERPFPALSGTLRWTSNRSWLMPAGSVGQALKSNDFGKLRLLLSGAGLTNPDEQQLVFERQAAEVHGLPEGVSATIEVSGEGLSPAPFKFTLSHPRTDVRMAVDAPDELCVTARNLRGERIKGFWCRVYSLPSSDDSAASPHLDHLEIDNNSGLCACPVTPDSRMRVMVGADGGLGWKDITTQRGLNKVEVILADGLTVTGQVVDETGGPVAELNLNFVNTDLDYETEVLTDAGGNFSARFPDYVNTAKVHANRLRKAFNPDLYFTAESLNAIYRQPVQVPSNSHRFVIVRVPLERQPGQVDLTFSTPRPLHSTDISLTGEVRRFYPAIPDTLRARPCDFTASTVGLLTFEAGIYRLMAHESNTMNGSILVSHFVEFEVKGGQITRANFALSEATAFEVRVVDQGGDPVSRVRVGMDGLASRGETTDEQGIARFGQHAPGRHVIAIQEGNWLAGENNSVTVTLTAPANSRDKVTPVEVRAIAAQIQVRVSGVGVMPSMFDMFSFETWQTRHSERQPDRSLGFRNIAPGDWSIRLWTKDSQEVLASVRFIAPAYSECVEFEYADGKLVQIKR